MTGDLTSAFDFETPNNKVVSLPSTVAYEPPDDVRHPDYVPAPPITQAMPQQETGTRPARALPYELHVHGNVDLAANTIELDFRNSGRAAAVFHVRCASGQFAPRTYTIDVNDSVSDTIALTGNSYDISVFGPNGFLRRFAGHLGAKAANLTVRTSFEKEYETVELEIHNRTSKPENVTVVEAYSGNTARHTVQAHDIWSHNFDVKKSFGWYDFRVLTDADSVFERQAAGHLETGKDSVTDPAIGKNRTSSCRRCRLRFRMRMIACGSEDLRVIEERHETEIHVQVAGGSGRALRLSCRQRSRFRWMNVIVALRKRYRFPCFRWNIAGAGPPLIGYTVPLIVHRLKPSSAAFSLAKTMLKVSSAAGAAAPVFPNRM